MNSRLYRYQYLSMAGLFCLANLFLPGIVAETVGKSAYPAFLPGYLLGLGLVAIHGAAFGKSSGGICSVARKRLGKAVGGAVGAVYLVYFLLIGCELMSFYGLYVSGEDPAALYLAPAAIAVLLAGGKSTTVLGRAALIFVVFALGLAAALGFSGIAAGNAENLRGFVSADRRTLGQIALSLGVIGAGQLIAVMTISPEKVRGMKNSLVAAAVGNGVVLLIALTSLLIEGQTPLLNQVPFFSYEIRGKLSQLRIVAEAVLFFCAIFRITVCLRAAACTAAELFRLPDERPLAPALGVLMFAMSMGLSENIGAAAEYVLRYSPMISAFPLGILPLVLICFRRKEAAA